MCEKSGCLLFCIFLIYRYMSVKFLIWCWMTVKYNKLRSFRDARKSVYGKGLFLKLLVCWPSSPSSSVFPHLCLVFDVSVGVKHTASTMRSLSALSLQWNCSGFLHIRFPPFAFILFSWLTSTTHSSGDTATLWGHRETSRAPGTQQLYPCMLLYAVLVCAKYKKRDFMISVKKRFPFSEWSSSSQDCANN